MITHTDEQQAIIEAHARSGPSVMVDALAGCAKSTTIELAAPGIKVPALALAFNKSIAAGMVKRMPGNFECKTMNGLGHGAWIRQLGSSVRVVLDDRKIGKLVTEVAKELGAELTSDQWTQVRELVGAAQRAGLVPGNQGNPLVEDNEYTWGDLADQAWIDSGDAPQAIELAWETLKRSNDLARQGIMSFDDQVYCPVVLGGKWGRFPHVIVDEAQDLSPLNHAMVGLSLRDGGRLTVVGDPRQAIYGFRGADHTSMGSMRRLREEWIDLGLTMTFRCPKVVVARQLDHAPKFRAWDGCVEGVFARVDPWAPDGATRWNWTTIARHATHISGSHIAILCRNNSPLFSLAFKLIRQGIGPVMLGRDLGKGLVGLSHKIAPDDKTLADQVIGLVGEWETREQGLALANGNDQKAAGVTDRAECLRAVLESGVVRDAGGLRGALAKLFSQESGMVTLSTIHRAKGLEWDLVMLLDPWRIPSKHAVKMYEETRDDRQLKQEFNLRYVAETRSKRVLLHGSLESFGRAGNDPDVE